MGVPGLTKFFVDRYPLVQKSVDMGKIPTVDYLYIDLNGILHLMTHGVVSLPRNLTNEQMFENIFDYVDKLLKMVNPTTLLFLAIDGVAPQAKLNQQRARRYLALLEKKNESIEEEKKEDSFDRNSITPGTSFTFELDHYINFRIREKVSDPDSELYDPLWANIAVVYSGPYFPGEGEHKIMDFIRLFKDDSKFMDTASHVIHGLDADLVILSLFTGVKNIALLREKQLLNGRISNDFCFNIFFISILRRCIAIEFDSLRHEKCSKIKYDFERVLRDLLFLTFLLGNDFIPHAPFVYIRNFALVNIWHCYKLVFGGLDKYIVDFNEINFDSFKIFVGLFGEYEYQHCKGLLSSFNVVPLGDISIEKMSDKKEREFLKTININSVYKFGDVEFDLVVEKNEEFSSSSDISLEGVYVSSEEKKKNKPQKNKNKNNKNAKDKIINIVKATYYSEKLFVRPTKNNPNSTKIDVKMICDNYFNTLRWILRYYTEGLASWSYQFCHHYAPFLSDVVDVVDPKNDSIDFKAQKSSPFTPVEQLLAVCPPSSSQKFMSRILSFVVSKANSPIVHLYPISFQCDPNGLKYEYEAISLLPFINVEFYREKMAAMCDTLFNKTNLLPPYLTAVFENYLYKRELNYYSKFNLISELQPLTRDLTKKNYKIIDINFQKINKWPDFDRFELVASYNSTIKSNRKLFSLCIAIQNDMFVNKISGNINLILNDYLNRHVYCNFPYQRYGKVVAIMHNKKIYTDKKVAEMNQHQVIKYQKMAQNIVQLHHQKMGGLNLLNVNNSELPLCQVATLKSMFIVPSNNANKKLVGLKPVWSRCFEYHLLPFLSRNLSDPRTMNLYEDKSKAKAKDGSDFNSLVHPKMLFNENSTWFCSGGAYYGYTVNITECRIDASNKIKATVNQYPLFSFNECEFLTKNMYDSYVSLNYAGKILSLNTNTLTYLLGPVVVKGGSFFEDNKNIGLNLTNGFNKFRKETIGYAKYFANIGLVLSDRAIALIGEYVKKFPKIILFLERNKNNLPKWPVFGSKEDKVTTATFEEMFECKFNHILSFNYYNTPNLVHNADSVSVDNEALLEMEALLTEFSEAEARNLLKNNKLNVSVDVQSLTYPFNPVIELDSTNLNEMTNFRLLEQVMFICSSIPDIPFGSVGTIVAIFTRDKQFDMEYYNVDDTHCQQYQKVKYVEVLFHSLLKTSTSLFSGRTANTFVVPYQWLRNITGNFEKFRYRTEIPKAWNSVLNKNEYEVRNLRK